MITNQYLVVHFYYFSNKRKIPSKKYRSGYNPQPWGRYSLCTDMNLFGPLPSTGQPSHLEDYLVRQSLQVKMLGLPFLPILISYLSYQILGSYLSYQFKKIQNLSPGLSYITLGKKSPITPFHAILWLPCYLGQSPLGLLYEQRHS